MVWTGDFRLGVGHVKAASYDQLETTKYRWNSAAKLTADEENCSHHWARGAVFKKEPRVMQLQANTAAKLAVIQKVAPSLNSVMSSLLMDGSAFFDGERFEDWCANFGYDSDSRKAEATFKACDDIGRAISRAVSRDELTGLREWAANQ